MTLGRAREMLATVPPFGQVARTKLRIHRKADCATPCPLHGTSTHHMKDWPMVLRMEIPGMPVERTCEHGVGHTDPDSVAFIRSRDSGWVDIHGCDGCCRA